MLAKLQIQQKISFPSTVALLSAWRGAREGIALLRPLFVDGSIDVVTPFTLNGEGKTFRTVLQADADIIQFIPQPPYQQNDDLIAYKAAFQLHIDALGQVIAHLSKGQQLVLAFQDWLLAMVNLAFVAQTFFSETTSSLYSLGISLAVSLVYRFTLKKQLIGWVLRTVLRSIGH